MVYKTTVFQGVRLSKSGVPCQEENKLAWAIALILKVKKEKAELMSVTELCVRDDQE